MKTLSPKKFSILGCGWLGLPLAQHLIQKKHLVKGSTTSPEKLAFLEKNGITPSIIKIENNKTNSNLTDFLTSDILVIDVPFGKQKENFKAYKQLAFAVENSSIKKIIFISSTSVYSDTNSEVTESATFEINPAKKVLVDLENLFLNHPGFETTILRFSGLIGGTRNPGNFFKEGRIVQNGLAPINLIHLEDCIEIIRRVAEGSFGGEIFNASADTHPTRKEFYTAATLLQNKTPATFIENIEFSYKIISNDKLKRKLNYTFLYSDLMAMVKIE